jgi:hypothetical protein
MSSRLGHGEAAVPHWPLTFSLCTRCSSGDPYNETNWGWFEDQKKVKTGIRLRFGLGGTDDLDGLEENHDPFVEVRLIDSYRSTDDHMSTIGQSKVLIQLSKWTPIFALVRLAGMPWDLDLPGSAEPLNVF